MSFSTQRFTCSQVTFQTPALKAEGTLEGPKITEVTGNTVGVLLSVIRDSLVFSEVESQQGFVIDGRVQCYKTCNE